VTNYLGGILTGFFAQPAVFGPYIPTYPVRYAGVFYNIDNDNGDQGRQLGIQLYGVTVTILYATVASFVIFKCVDMTLGLKLPEGEEEEEMHLAQDGRVAQQVVSEEDI
jgi:Amt family ammonium transporter